MSVRTPFKNIGHVQATGIRAVLPELVTKLPDKLDFAGVGKVMAQIGLPFPGHLQAEEAPRNASNSERVRGFAYDRHDLDDALAFTGLSIEDRVRLKTALAGLGVLK
jgi:hypothetical protein